MLHHLLQQHVVFVEVVLDFLVVFLSGPHISIETSRERTVEANPEPQIVDVTSTLHSAAWRAFSPITHRTRALRRVESGNWRTLHEPSG